MSDETTLLEALKKAPTPAFAKNAVAIHYGDGTWINKQRIVEELKELKEKILTYHNLYVIDLLIEKIEKL